MADRQGEQGNSATPPATPTGNAAHDASNGQGGGGGKETVTMPAKDFRARIGHVARVRDHWKEQAQRERKLREEAEAKLQEREEGGLPDPSEDPDEYQRGLLERVDKRIGQLETREQRREASARERAQKEVLYDQIHETMGNYPTIQQLGVEDLAAREVFVALQEDPEADINGVIADFAERFDGVQAPARKGEGPQGPSQEELLRGAPAPEEGAPTLYEGGKTLSEDEGLMKQHPRDREQTMFSRNRKRVQSYVRGLRSRLP